MLTIVAGAIYPYMKTPETLLSVGFVLIVGIYILTALLYGVYTSELFPTEVRLRANGLCNMLGRGATVVSPFIVLCAVQGLRRGRRDWLDDCVADRPDYLYTSCIQGIKAGEGRILKCTESVHIHICKYPAFDISLHRIDRGFIVLINSAHERSRHAFTSALYRRGQDPFICNRA